jgi:uncharacterized repeat protein (TIGR03803 family)
MKSRMLSACAGALILAVFAGDRAWSATRTATQRVFTEKVLFSFNQTDGAYPAAGLIFDRMGNLYGTTECGAILHYGCGGTVFELTPGRGGQWTERLLPAFVNEGDPVSPLIFDRDGNLYGTVQFGGWLGGRGSGAVFELSPGTDGWTYRKLHVFAGPGGSFPTAGVVMDGAGNLYGANAYGGAQNAGTAFELSRDAYGDWNATILHTFYLKPTDGSRPSAAMTFDHSDKLYGTTYLGGGGSCGNCGPGTVFELTPATREEHIVHSFQLESPTDGANPVAGLISDRDRNLYGTTLNGGAYGKGTIYELTPEPFSSRRWTEHVLYSFGRNSGRDGIEPAGGLVFDGQGNLYGTTAGGGINTCHRSYSGCGVVFEFARDSRGPHYAVLYRFAGGSDGENPQSTLVLDRRGNLFGTTSYGGAFGYGTVFEITPR